MAIVVAFHLAAPDRNLEKAPKVVAESRNDVVDLWRPRVCLSMRQRMLLGGKPTVQGSSLQC